ncbi:hypothetical protein C2E23DRAFT_829828 [Lenzites betulinus]|nr:hypothetical protein C2E23DRAFT_829828 [Lenzites betulinus]
MVSVRDGNKLSIAMLQPIHPKLHRHTPTGLHPRQTNIHCRSAAIGSHAPSRSPCMPGAYARPHNPTAARLLGKSVG